MFDLREAGVGQSGSCPKPASLPRDYSRAVGTFLEGRGVVVCGGEDVGNTRCGVFDPSANRWDEAEDVLTVGREEASAAFLPDGRWWIAGGKMPYEVSDILLASTEVVNSDLKYTGSNKFCSF